MENRPPRPNNYLALAIISAILCCPPAGIVSIVYAAKVDGAYIDGNYEKALNYSNNAKTWGIISIVVSIAGWLIYVLIFGLAFFGAIFSNASY